MTTTPTAPAQNPDHPREILPLDGERACVCGQAEGLHRSDGTCEASGCWRFVACIDGETPEVRPDAPEIRIEYDPGQGPR